MENKKWTKIESSPTWDFKEEKELVGYYVGVETEVGENKSNLYTFRKENGETIAVWGNTVLDIRFRNLIKDEEVKIVYKGKEKSEKTGREFHNFDVFHRKPEFKNVDGEIPILEEPPY